VLESFQLPTRSGTIQLELRGDGDKMPRGCQNNSGWNVSSYSGGGRSVFLAIARRDPLCDDLGICQFQGCQAGPAVSEARATARDSAWAVNPTCLPGLDQTPRLRTVSLSNRRVSEGPILSRGHFQATRDRVAAANGPILILHDHNGITSITARRLKRLAF